MNFITVRFQHFLTVYSKQPATSLMQTMRVLLPAPKKGASERDGVTKVPFRRALCPARSRSANDGEMGFPLF